MAVRNLFLRLGIMLVVAISFQNCKIYGSAPVSVDHAVESNKRVKVYDTQMNAYKFNHLEFKNGELIGVAKKKSKTTKKLLGKDVLKERPAGYVDVPLTEMEIKEVYEQNEDASVAVYMVSLGLAAAAALYFLFFAVN